MKRTHLLGIFIATLTSKKIFDQLTLQDLKNKTVLITGGTTGLGFELMRQLLEEGCQVAVCARDSVDLYNLNENYPEIMTYRCDVGNKEEVEDFVSKTIMHFGKIDIVINNAGIIMVAPMEGFTEDDYKHAMDIMYLGIVHTTFAVLPHMKARREGQIVNITSVGGKVSIPHLLPYSAAKFAAVGFSEGIAVELRQHNIFVTTIIPGLMRTGSYINALFQEDNKLSFKLFSAISSAPVLTITAEKAARKTIRAMREKRAMKVIGVPAKILIELHHFFPETLSRLMTYTAELLPGWDTPENLMKGEEMSEKFDNAEVPGLEILGHKAQEDFQGQQRE
jgi:short-subunit dehydrogenase